MIKTNELKRLFDKKGIFQAKMADYIGITPKIFYEKMKIGVFGSYEIQIMINKLDIDNPIDIFLQIWYL